MSLVLEAKNRDCKPCRAGATGFPAFIRLCAGIPNHARQSLRFAAHAEGELLGRVPDDLQAETLEPLAHLGQAQRAHVSAVQDGDDAAGVSAGATVPNQPLISYPGSPDSAIVGSSGASGERRAPATASARSFPDFASGTPFGVPSA